MYKVTCKRCGYEAIGDSESDLISKMRKHSIEAHKEEKLSEEMLEDIKDAVRN